MLGLLRRIAIDITRGSANRVSSACSPRRRRSRVSGTQAALVALPYQIFVISHSPALVGLLGAFELGPMVVVSLVGGALNDRHDRRVLLAIAQLAVIAAAGALCVASLLGHPRVVS